MKDIYIRDDSNFYKNIKKYTNKNVVVHFLYEENDIIDDSNIDQYFSIKNKIHIIHALNIKNSKKRYSYIYDVVCNYLDNEFKINNICDFKDNKCISVRNNGHCEESCNGCCYGTNRELCINFKDGKCNIQSLSCKLFTCRYLKKKGVKFSVNDIDLLKYFFNLRQKYILDTSIFKDKDEIIDLLLKYQQQLIERNITQVKNINNIVKKIKNYYEIAFL